jgi:tyrosine-protein kinase Etk/Wzc
MTPTQRLEYSHPAFIDARVLPVEQNGGDDIDLRALLGTLIDHKRFILTVTAVFFLAGLAYVLLTRPVYQATALLKVEQAPSLPGITAV